MRAGSIVPMGPVRQFVGDQPDAPIELHVYPGRDASFLLYEDEGDGYNYEDGAFSTINIQWHDAARQLILGERMGSYAGLPEKREFHLILHGHHQVGPGLPETERRTRVIYAGTPISVDL